MPDSPTTIHPFPELRAYAESEARARRQRLFTVLTAPGMGFYGSELRAGTPDITFWTDAVVAEWCDLTRPASRDAVCRLVAKRIAWPAWEVAKAEDNWTTLVALCRTGGIPEPARWEPRPPFAVTLTAIVRHLWPENADAR